MSYDPICVVRLLWREVKGGRASLLRAYRVVMAPWAGVYKTTIPHETFDVMERWQEVLPWDSIQSGQPGLSGTAKHAIFAL